MPDDDPSLIGQIKAKLIESKQKWAEDGRLLTGRSGDPTRERLPPGQREVKDWPVLDLGIQPHLPLDRWRLDIDGLVENPVQLDWAAFQALPQTRQVCDIHCVTSWSRYDNQFDGVSSADLLALVRPRPEARHIVFHSYDGYTTNVSLEVFSAPDAMLATGWNGQPITREHGGPVRGVIPQFYFWKSAKWIKRIEFVAQDQPGFWEVRGYHNVGDPWTEERYS